MPTKTCINCHFFVKEHRTTTPAGILAVDQAERTRARDGDFDWAGPYTLCCSFGVWDEGAKSPDFSREREILSQNRADFCFFWKRRPGMLLPAAKILQERESIAIAARLDRRLTIIGLWIAALALTVDVTLRMIDYCTESPSPAPSISSSAAPPGNTTGGS